LAVGHIPDRATLVVGSQAQLLAQGAEVSLTMHYRLPHLASAPR
jgi:muramoyltetrapeptide carboxypeptidase LdcA involved in peptidoglycan recycling